ncbi:DUF6233 domain-containing protein [Streptomyces mirabilis]|uniref:DUF6233 domain-containing protein n=1 Tax=Streptomyces mirabilis TaxID=68239 RepID=UPI00362AB5CC
MAPNTGDCPERGERSKGVTRDTALRTLTEGGAPACPHCRSVTALGILEGLFRRPAAAVRSSTFDLGQCSAVYGGGEGRLRTAPTRAGARIRSVVLSRRGAAGSRCTA